MNWCVFDNNEPNLVDPVINSVEEVIVWATIVWAVNVPRTKKLSADEAVAANEDETDELTLLAYDAVVANEADVEVLAYDAVVANELDTEYELDSAYDADKAYDAENPTSTIDSVPLSFFRYNLPSNVFKANSPNSTWFASGTRPGTALLLSLIFWAIC